MSNDLDQEGVKKDPYDFSSIFLAMAVAMILWYGVNLLAERLDISFSVGDIFANVLIFFLLFALLIALLLLLPVYMSRELILRWTGKRLRVLRVFFVLFFSLTLTSLLFALASSLFALGSLEITSQESGGALETVVMIFYYTATALLAAFWLWKRPEIGEKNAQEKSE